MPSQNRRVRGRRSKGSSHFRPLRIEPLEDRRLLAAAITVNSTADNNVRDAFLTLREAILVNNRTLAVASLSAQEQAQVVGMPTASDTDTIGFNISGVGPHTIRPTSALPNITDPVVIDGYTQSGASANSNAGFQSLNTTLQIELAGNLTPASTGLRLAAGSGGSTIRGIAINGFGNNIWIDTHGNAIAGNFIGTNITGTAAMPGAANGVLLISAANNTIGGTNPADRNLVSGNGPNGITIVSAGANDNVIKGNFIGTDITGTIDLGNGLFGVYTAGALRTIVGGVEAGEGNLISGNVDHGILFENNSHDGVVQGNRIGTDLTGTLPLGNGGGGVQVQNSSRVLIGGTVPGAGNIIADNAGNGVILVGGNESLVQGNWIGTNDSGVDLGNGVNGVLIVNSPRNQIGGDPGGNTIAFNAADGVNITKTGSFLANRNLIRANSIHSNGELGIELSLPDGPNFPHTFALGANDNQNFPILTSVVESGGTTTVKGTLSFLSGTYRIEFFANAAVDASGFGEGQTFLGSIEVPTFSGEVATFTATLPALPSGQTFVTATATNIHDSGAGTSNNTSEFSPAFAAPTVFVVTTTADSGAGSLRQAILDANAHAGYDRIEFDFPAHDPRHFYYQDDGIPGQVTLANVTVTTASDDTLIEDIDPDWAYSWYSIAPLSALPDLSDPVEIDGYSQTGASENGNFVNNGLNSVLRVEISGANAGVISTGMLRSFRTGNVLIRGLAMNRVQGAAISLNQASGSRVEGSYLGTDVSGSLSFETPSSVGIAGQAVSQVVIGGTTPAARNLISGNSTGVNVSSIVADNRLEGNLIGTDRSGTRALGNGLGVAFGRNSIVGGPETNARNVISGNGTGVAVFIESIIQNNYIGTDVTGTMDMGNTGYGVSLGINTRDNQVLGNIVAFNGSTGVSIDAGNIVGFGNLVSQNAIYSNGGPGIDLDDNGNQPNDIPPQSDPPDQDNGPNRLQNFPILTSVVDLGPGTRIEGTLLSTPDSDFRLEFFANAERDEETFSNSLDVKRGEFAEGQTFIGTLDVTTGGNGKFDFSIDLGVDLLALPGLGGQPYVTATATDITMEEGKPRNNTSEFSKTFPLGGPSTVVTNSRLSGLGSFHEAFIGWLLAPELEEITFDMDADDPRHFYYMDDGLPGVVSTSHIAATTEANDANIVGIDPDWTHSWFSLQPNFEFPEIEKQFIIDGFSQPGSSPNTLTAPNGLDTVLKIEIDGSNIDGPGFHMDIGAELSLVQGLAINSFGGSGIDMESIGANRIFGNFIGTDVSGTVAKANGGDGISLIYESLNRIGGSDPAKRNLISGNAGNGIANRFWGGSLIQGNLIGSDRTGTKALVNGEAGIRIDQSAFMTVGGLEAGTGNLIVSNSTNAIEVIDDRFPDPEIVETVITDYESARASALQLIHYRDLYFATEDPQHAIDALTAAIQLALPFQQQGAVLFAQANTFLGNEIRVDGVGGLGIDLAGDGVTPNDMLDADGGPNNLRNFPVLTSASSNGGTTSIQGTAHIVPNTAFRIEFFANDQLLALGHGPAERYLGFTEVITDGNGDASFTAVLTASVQPGSFVTSTATYLFDLDENPATPLIAIETSELSAGIIVTAGASLTGDYNKDGFVNAADYVVWRDTLGSTANLAANGDDSNNVIDEADYQVWVDNFGAPLGSGSGRSVPVPSNESPSNSEPALSGTEASAVRKISRRARAAAIADMASTPSEDKLLLLQFDFLRSNDKDAEEIYSAIDHFLGESEAEDADKESLAFHLISI